MANPERWYLRSDSRLEISPISKYQAFGKKIETAIGSSHWATKLNEIQMLLHQHEANAEREQQGLLALNSIWLWGGSAEYLPPTLQPYSVVLANEPLLKGLAQQRCQPLPGSAEELPKVDTCLIVLNELDSLHLEQKWATNLLTMLKKNADLKLNLHIAQEKSINSYELRRQDLWKFWRRWGIRLRPPARVP
jgi:hypothetical protein